MFRAWDLDWCKPRLGWSAFFPITKYKSLIKHQSLWNSNMDHLFCLLKEGYGWRSPTEILLQNSEIYKYSTSTFSGNPEYKPLAKLWYCQLERGFPNISWPLLAYLTQIVGQLSAVHKVSYHFWRHISFSPKLLKIWPLFIWTFFISMTWQINSLNEWHSSWITRYIRISVVN